jgi:hypothetical protein
LWNLFITNSSWNWRALSSGIYTMKSGESQVVDFHQPAWGYIPEDRNFHNNHCENLSFFFLELFGWWMVYCQST